MDNNHEEQKIKESFWESLKVALKYAFHSAKGRYNLDSYLEILSRFTDEEINSELDKGFVYDGGEVTFYAQQNKNVFKIVIEMIFYDIENKKKYLKKAERELEKKMFVEETISQLEKNGITTFEIKAPRRA